MSVRKRVTAYCPQDCHLNEGYLQDPVMNADEDALKIARGVASEHTRKTGHYTTVVIEYRRR